MKRAHRNRRVVGVIAATLVLGLLAAACGGSGDEGGGGGGDGGSSSTPTPGGEVVYGLEAETSGGWCLPESQLAISGIMVARAIYDTLVVPDFEGNMQPFLAESITPNADYTQWTVKLREGITFHDGTALDATVVKNNLDAFRGQYPARPKVLLLRFVLEPIADVAVVDPLTVSITTKIPWPSLPSSLYYSGRVGMVAQAQLDDPETCNKNLIGTGPFMLESWTPGDKLRAVKNPDYWAKDAEGNQLPYLDAVEFRPIIDGTARVNALLSGQLQALHTTGAPQVKTLETEAEAGAINLQQSSDYAEIAYGMLNMSRAPFDNPIARQAVAHAIDRDQFNQVINLDLFEIGSGPFGPGEIGYLEDAGFPKYDPEEAKKLVAQYEQETGEDFSLTLTHANDPETTKIAQFIQEGAKKVGIEVNIKGIEQAQLINTALGGDWQAISWRNHPGGNPDTQYNWWYTGSPINFGKINDPEIDALLDKGRSESDPAARKQIYEDVNRRFSEQVYNLWLNWSEWNIATDPNVQGVFGAQLPTGQEPFPGLAAGHTLSGMWIEK